MLIPVQRFMPDAIAEVLRKAPLSPEKVSFAWRTAVGPSVDRATEVSLDGHVLRVRAKDAAWQREVERSASLICARLGSLLGEGLVRGLDVSVKSDRAEARCYDNPRRSTQL